MMKIGERWALVEEYHRSGLKKKLHAERFLAWTVRHHGIVRVGLGKNFTFGRVRADGHVEVAEPPPRVKVGRRRKVEEDTGGEDHTGNGTVTERGR
jgi:FAD synthase